MHSLSIEQARRFLLLKHGLLGPRRFAGREGVLAFIRQAGSIQFDPIDICGRNPDLVLQSRVEGYSRQTLSSLLYEDRRLVDYFDKELCIFPAEDWPYFSYMRKERGDWMRSREEINAAREIILNEIRTRGPLCSKDIESDGRVNWFWGATRLPRAVLEHLFYSGELGIHHKKKAIKYYDLIERCLPREVLDGDSGFESEEALHRFLLLRRIGAVGLLWNRASSAWLGFPNFKAEQRNRAFSSLIESGQLDAVRVDGVRDTFYMLPRDAALLEQAKQGALFAPRCELIAPLDNLMWDRPLIECLFDFSYTWEIYTPPAKRRYGYYVLPILLGEQLIGRAEPVIDKKTGTLQLKGFWPEEGTDPDSAEVKGALLDCLARFEDFHRRSREV